jgi:3-oxoacyl-[acyl-carrier protein] reductase
LHGNFGQANYATAKMGVVGLTKTIAKEWGAFGVRCNAIAYGFIDTRLTQDKVRLEAIKITFCNVTFSFAYWMYFYFKKKSLTN